MKRFGCNRIPKEILQKVPTTLLHSLEGMEGLNWDSLLQLKCEDGSFLFSPSSTAFALMETKDQHCLQYLTKIVHKFNGGGNIYLNNQFYSSNNNMLHIFQLILCNICASQCRMSILWTYSNISGLLIDCKD